MRRVGSLQRSLLTSESLLGRSLALPPPPNMFPTTPSNGRDYGNNRNLQLVTLPAPPF
jgi:hypothetical protein